MYIPCKPRCPDLLSSVDSKTINGAHKPKRIDHILESCKIQCVFFYVQTVSQMPSLLIITILMLD